MQWSQLSNDIWTAQAPVRFLSFHFTTRMTVVRRRDGSVWLHSPIPLSEELRRNIDAIGEVRAAVAPNRFHHLYAGEVKEHYPDAKLFAAPGLKSKRPDLAIDEELGEREDGEEFRYLLIGGGRPLNEYVFLHKASATLICSDLLQNISGSDHLPTRLYMKLVGIHGKPGVSRLVRLAFRDRAATRAGVDEVLQWPFERIVLAHGDVVTDSPHDVLRNAWRWLK